MRHPPEARGSGRVRNKYGYDHDYIKVNGEWKFHHLRAIGRMAAPYEKGWANKQQ
jgi:hypothetical protein